MSNELRNAVRLISDYCKAQDGQTCIDRTCPINSICIHHFKDLPENWNVDEPRSQDESTT